jgi:hypothetical protein
LRPARRARLLHAGWAGRVDHRWLHPISIARGATAGTQSSTGVARLHRPGAVGSALARAVPLSRSFDVTN